MNEPPKRKRRWYQFSLRTLLIGATLFAGLSAASVWVVRDRQRLIQERDEAVDRFDLGIAYRVRKDSAGLSLGIPPDTSPEVVAKLHRLYPNARFIFFSFTAAKPTTIQSSDGRIIEVIPRAAPSNHPAE